MIYHHSESWTQGYELYAVFKSFSYYRRPSLPFLRSIAGCSLKPDTAAMPASVRTTEIRIATALFFNAINLAGASWPQVAQCLADRWISMDINPDSTVRRITAKVKLAMLHRQIERIPIPPIRVRITSGGPSRFLDPRPKSGIRFVAKHEAFCFLRRKKESVFWAR